MAPSERVRKAMARLTRDKWMPPSEVHQTALALARHCTHGNAAACAVVKAAVPLACIAAVGMVRGGPPAHPEDPHYLDVFQAVRNNERRGAAYTELALLRCIERAQKGYN